jgi:WD40 repeat protein
VDRATGAPHHVLTGHTAPVDRLAFSPDGRLLATAAADRTVRLWNPATGALAGATSNAGIPAFSPDGRLLATADAAGTVHLLDTGILTDLVQALCDRTGGLDPAGWSRYAPGEPFDRACPKTV